MGVTKNPRLLARIAGVFYLTIILSAMWSYRQVRGELFVQVDMARTAANIVAHQHLYRMGIAGCAVTVLCDAIMGILLYELLKPVNRRLALIGLVFLAISAAIEAVNIFN